MQNAATIAMGRWPSRKAMQVSMELHYRRVEENLFRKYLNRTIPPDWKLFLDALATTFSDAIKPRKSKDYYIRAIEEDSPANPASEKQSARPLVKSAPRMRRDVKDKLKRTTPTEVLLRAARPNEGKLLYNTLCESAGMQLEGDEDISSEKTFERWLSIGRIHFCIAEAADGSPRHRRVKGFYSIFPLKVDAFVALTKGALHHDEIDKDHLVEGVFSPRSTGREEKNTVAGADTVLFVLDLEVIRGGIDRRSAVYLTIDMIEQLRRASLHANVVAFAALGATPEGKNWCDVLGMGGDRSKQYKYWRVKHKDWTLFEADGASAKQAFERLVSLGWPKMSENQYPYAINEQFQAALKALNQFAN